MSILKHLLPDSIQRPYRILQKRLDKLELSVRGLEAAVDALVVSPKYVPGDEIGFNGQSRRKQIFQDLTKAIPFDAIVETGTWLGNSTGYMSQTAGLPVYSCELNPRFHALAKMRLLRTSRIVDITIPGTRSATVGRNPHLRRTIWRPGMVLALWGTSAWRPRARAARW